MILASLGDNLVALVLSVVLITYLVVVLIAPERF